jgi:flavin reductase (DIM6/NTAB) family NADH-FMN oxidoreductase RutF
MDEKAKKHALRMIPYGLYVLTARTPDGVNAATVSWLSQASFDPPRVVAALRNDSGIWHRPSSTMRPPTWSAA